MSVVCWCCFVEAFLSRFRPRSRCRRGGPASLFLCCFVCLILMCVYIYIYIYVYLFILICAWVFVCFITCLMCLVFPARATRAARCFSIGFYLAGRVNGQNRVSEGTPDLPTNIAGFRGFDSSVILILRGGILRYIGDYPESLIQAMLVGIMLVGRLGVPSL